jgi:hypothetical protein
MQERQQRGPNQGAMRKNGVQVLLPFYREGAQRFDLIEQGKKGDSRELDGQRPPRPSYRMHTALTTLIDRLDGPTISGTDVIRWGCPVPSFGDLSSARVATVGLNPSNREFVDELGNELQGPFRRFHTLRSLGLTSWSDIDARHLRLIIESCRSYFLGNPYETWFKRMEKVVSGARASFYDPSCAACHLDLIPYATARKWTELTARQRSLLLAAAGDSLGVLLRDSPVRMLILNGRSVVEQFQDIAGVCLEQREMPSWSLSRQSKRDVPGIGYRGMVETISGVRLPHRITVVGYNHNIQGSFGVTTEVVRAIREWIAQSTDEVAE